ncbi:asialoglycoprotein receptor-like 1 isoform X2 [Antennarius striatus]|uniref:asialoglycoprotein receptor-like 1 isoform X2 n=1 Tax=Antennarius striatus TaxID=241820 RepID=UPI0035AEBD1D
MVRVQPDKNHQQCSDGAMEPQYHQFGPSPEGPENRTTLQTGVKRMLVYILYGVLVLLLLILLLVTGVKFSQLNTEVRDIKLQLKTISGGEHASAAAPHVHVDKLVPQRGSCREGWVTFQRSCYLVSIASITWHNAEKQCQAKGGHLLVLNNMEELDFISRIVETQYDYWIGLVERQHEGHWSWVDGTAFNSSAAYWDEGQPDNWDYRENGEDCGQIHSSVQRVLKKWNDADCQLSYRYICEARV